MTNKIKKPLISEKSFLLASSGKDSFIVDSKISKNEAKTSIEKILGVKVVSVNSANICGKVKRVKGKIGRRQNYKKVIFTLKPGQKIDLFEIEDKTNDKKETKAERKSIKEVAKDRIKPRTIRGRKENNPTALTQQGQGK